MRKIGAYELKTHLSQVLDSVEHGQTVVVTRYGKRIARISPDFAVQQEKVSHAVKSLLNFPRTPLPKGVTIRKLIKEGQGLRDSFGSWADDAQELDHFLQEIRHDRKNERDKPA